MILLALLWLGLIVLAGCGLWLAHDARRPVEHPYWRHTPEPKRVRLIREEADA